MRTPLTMLDNVQIASPCTADWNQMTGDDHVRHCAHCAKDVYNLSALSAEAAVALLTAKRGNLCVRLYRRADGTVLTEDCPVGWRHKVGRLAGRWLAAAASCLGITSLAGCGYHQEAPPMRDTGKVERPVAPPQCILGEMEFHRELAPMPREEPNPVPLVPL
jgi:hypothetical protein